MQQSGRRWRSAMWFVAIASVVAWLLWPTPPSMPRAQGGSAASGFDRWHQIDIEGLQREYLIHLPPGAELPHATPRPVVLALHGAGSNAAGMAHLTLLSRKANRADFIVVYPQGTPLATQYLRTWNAGGCCGSGTVDDVAFIGAVLDDVERRYAVDRARVYATGLSNGAMMVYRLASELSDRLAAVAAVGGAMAQAQAQPKRPVPIIHFHGDADTVASFDGGFGARSLAKAAHQSVRHTIAHWIALNRCNEQPQVEQLPNVVADGTTVRRESYAAQAGGAPVVLYVIEGGGHNWPGRPPIDELMGPLRISNLSRTFVRFGASTRDINANDLMWSFFQQFQLDDSALAAHDKKKPTP